LGAAADLARRLEAEGCTVAPPTEHPMHGVAESRWVAPERVVAAAELARAADFFFESMTCVDRLDPHGVFELIYTLNRFDEFARIALRVWARQGASVPTLSGVYPMAAWNEREAWEFYGLDFAGHPDLTWLLLPEGTAFRPLLKSFTAPPPSIFDDSLNPQAPAADEHEHTGH
jgi:NADH-quinone oxidoreductase subunit C